MVSKHSHHSFPNAPTLSSPSHSSPKCSTPFVAGPCHACCPRLALPHLPQPCCSMQVKSSCAPAPDLAQHSSLCVSYKKPPEELPLHLKSSLLGAGFFFGVGLVVCVFGVSVCLGFSCVPSLQLQVSLCIIPSPRKSATVQFMVSSWCNFPVTISELLRANVCWRLLRVLNLTESKPRLSYN